MKRFALFAASAAICLVALAGCSKHNEGMKTDPPEYRLYGVPNVRIEFEYSGGASGTKVLNVGNYGMYERSEDDFSVKMGGSDQKVRQLILRNDSLQYTIDLVKKEGTTTASQIMQLMPMMRDFNAEQKKNVNLELMRRMGSHKLGEEEVLGKKCEIFDVEGFMKVWVWNGLTLRSEMQMGGMKMILTAKKIDENPSLSIDMFQPPNDVKMRAVPVGGMPPGHPSVDGAEGGAQGMPEGHPPVDGGTAPSGDKPAGEMPAGHPPMGH